MIRNYLILAYRNLAANKLVSGINILGLSIATACVVVVFLFLQNYWTLDNFHVNGDRIYLVEYQVETDQGVQTWGNAPSAMAAVLTADFPQVERSVRMEHRGVRVSMNGNNFEERITYADTGFLKMFTFPLAMGDPSALADPDAVILSSATAEKYFGREMPLGKSITVTDENHRKRQYTVRGVAEPFPQNAGFWFNMLTGFNNLNDEHLPGAWAVHVSGVFFQLKQPEALPDLDGKLDRYTALYNADNPDTPAKSFVFENLRHPADNAYMVFNRPTEAAHPALALIFGLIAGLMMALSCFNYVNISLGSASRRLKEIGIRKVMGGARKQLVFQFLTENLVLCIGALLLGLVLTDAVLVPLFNHVMVMKIDLSFSKNGALWFFLPGLLVFTGLASGAYPAFYISSFKPTAIFSGKERFGGKNIFSRLFLTLQFVIAFLAVITVVVLMYAGRYWAGMDWGYNPENSLVVQLDDSDQFGLLRDEALKSPGIVKIAGSLSHLGRSMSRETVVIGDKNTDVFRYDVGPGYLQTMGLPLQKGRLFDENLDRDSSNAILINQTLAENEGWSDAVGQSIRIDGATYTVAGVVGDFKFVGSGARQPSIFVIARESDYQYLVARFAPGNGQRAEQDLKKSWNRLFDEPLVNYFFQKDVFENFYRAYNNVSASAGYLSGLALLIACMGLYGLAAQHYTRRVKEMGIRKVLGASVSRIIFLANRYFLLMLVIAGSVATIISYVGIKLILNSLKEYTGELDPGIFPFLLANLIVLFTAVIAVGRQSYKITNVSLSDVLREE